MQRASLPALVTCSTAAVREHLHCLVSKTMPGSNCSGSFEVEECFLNSVGAGCLGCAAANLLPHASFSMVVCFTALSLWVPSMRRDLPSQVRLRLALKKEQLADAKDRAEEQLNELSNAEAVLQRIVADRQTRLTEAKVVVKAAHAKQAELDELENLVSR